MQQMSCQQPEKGVVQVYAWSKLQAEAEGREPPPLSAAFTYELCAGDTSIRELFIDARGAERS